jgi:hypothetical protein
MPFEIRSEVYSKAFTHAKLRLALSLSVITASLFYAMLRNTYVPERVCQTQSVHTFRNA